LGILKMNDLQVPEIPGADTVVSWFGWWPSFHDAEVLHLHLNRTGVSQLSVHTWNMTGDVDAKGFFRREKHAVVNFELQGISNLELSDFSQQNVLASLDIMLDGEGAHVELCPSHGLGGRIDAASVTVSVVPGAPKLG
jgi:hypothetical protein